MLIEPTRHGNMADAPAASLASPSRWQEWQDRARCCLDKSNENYLLNLFTALLLASALTIMLVVGVTIYAIYSSAMVKNAEAAAISVVKAIMSTQVDYLLQKAPDGNLVLAVHKADISRLDLQVRRYL